MLQAEGESSLRTLSWAIGEGCGFLVIPRVVEWHPIPSESFPFYSGELAIELIRPSDGSIVSSPRISRRSLSALTTANCPSEILIESIEDVLNELFD